MCILLFKLSTMRKVAILILLAIISVACNEMRDKPVVSGTHLSTKFEKRYKPQFHFSPSSGWLNDPNGLVYHEGVYHLFYQYYPHATVWGPMHWAMR